jgi:hypothetical protein
MGIEFFKIMYPRDTRTKELSATALKNVKGDGILLEKREEMW